jgi:hypothetical protein
MDMILINGCHRFLCLVVQKNRQIIFEVATNALEHRQEKIVHKEHADLLLNGVRAKIRTYWRMYF